MFENLYTSLKELGLSNLEINLYTVSLKLGPSPISTIAKHLDVSRPNVYKIIKSLEGHGLVKFSDKKKFSRDFMVESPTLALDKLREKRNEISSIDNSLVSALPELLALYHQGEGATKIKVLKGKEQYIKIFNQSVEEEKHEIQFCGSAGDFINFVSWEVEDDWIKKRLKRGINIKVLALQNEMVETLSKKDTKELRETRLLKTEQLFRSSFMLYANKMIIWQPKGPLAVLVEDQYIVEMMKELFKLLWQVSSVEK